MYKLYLMEGFIMKQNQFLARVTMKGRILCHCYMPMSAILRWKNKGDTVEYMVNKKIIIL